MAKGARVTRNGKRRVPRSKRKATATKATPRRSAGRPVKASPAAAAIAAGVIASPKPIRFQPTFATRSASLTVRAGAEPKAQTIIYVHGIGNKPKQSVLKCQWDTALFGTGLGDRSRMAYWVNRDYYPKPEDTTCGEPDHTAVEDDEATTATIMALAVERSVDEARPIEREIKALADSPEEEAFLASIAEELRGKSQLPAAVSTADVNAKLLFLPPKGRERVVQGLTRVALRDVHDFFFVEERRKIMTDSLAERLSAGGGPFVVVAHSQGTMIAYEVLRQLKKADCDVQLLVTLGSPLGLQEVQDVFRSWTGIPAGKKLPRPPCVTRWCNVAERLDPVAFNSDLTDEFEDVENKRKFLLNPDSPFHPHSAYRLPQDQMGAGAGPRYGEQRHRAGRRPDGHHKRPGQTRSKTARPRRPILH